MEQDTIIEGNKKCLKFMGYVRKPELDDEDMGAAYWRYSDNDNHYVSKVKYHSSWDWQIPVWVKIATISQKYAADEENAIRHNKLCDDYESAIFQNKPELGFEVIVKAIDWFNTQNK